MKPNVILRSIGASVLSCCAISASADDFGWKTSEDKPLADLFKHTNYQPLCIMKGQWGGEASGDNSQMQLLLGHLVKGEDGVQCVLGNERQSHFVWLDVDPGTLKWSKELPQGGTSDVLVYDFYLSTWLSSDTDEEGAEIVQKRRTLLESALELKDDEKGMLDKKDGVTISWDAAALIPITKPPVVDKEKEAESAEGGAALLSEDDDPQYLPGMFKAQVMLNDGEQKSEEVGFFYLSDTGYSVVPQDAAWANYADDVQKIRVKDHYKVAYHKNPQPALMQRGLRYLMAEYGHIVGSNDAMYMMSGNRLDFSDTLYQAHALSGVDLENFESGGQNTAWFWMRDGSVPPGFTDVEKAFTMQFFDNTTRNKYLMDAVQQREESEGDTERTEVKK